MRPPNYSEVDSVSVSLDAKSGAWGRHKGAVFPIEEVELAIDEDPTLGDLADAPPGPRSGFGKERTAADYRARIEWETWAARKQRSLKHEALAQAHDLARKAYEREFKKKFSDLGDLDVADEIWRQLGKARVMIGAKDPMGDKDSLTFKVGANPKRVKWIKVRLDPSDTYTVIFLNSKGRPLHEVDDIYSDNLARVIEMHTGLRTSL
jgi:hypothetical protein